MWTCFQATKIVHSKVHLKKKKNNKIFRVNICWFFSQQYLNIISNMNKLKVSSRKSEESSQSAFSIKRKYLTLGPEDCKVLFMVLFYWWFALFSWEFLPTCPLCPKLCSNPRSQLLRFMELQASLSLNSCLSQAFGVLGL